MQGLGGVGASLFFIPSSNIRYFSGKQSYQRILSPPIKAKILQSYFYFFIFIFCYLGGVCLSLLNYTILFHRFSARTSYLSLIKRASAISYSLRALLKFFSCASIILFRHFSKMMRYYRIHCSFFFMFYRMFIQRDFGRMNKLSMQKYGYSSRSMVISRLVMIGMSLKGSITGPRC